MSFSEEFQQNLVKAIEYHLENKDRAVSFCDDDLSDCVLIVGHPYVCISPRLLNAFERLVRETQPSFRNLLKTVCEDKKDDFLAFTNTGEDINNFLFHLKSCRKCRLAVEKAFENSSKALEELSRFINKKLTLGDYAKMVIGKNCFSCSKMFSLPITLEHYPHTNGYDVAGFVEKEWLFVVCSNQKCKYQNSLESLGIKH